MIRQNDPCDDIAIHIARSSWAGLQACGCPRVPAICRCVSGAGLDHAQRSLLGTTPADRADHGRWVEPCRPAE